MADQINPDQYVHLNDGIATIGFTADAVENTYNFSIANLQVNSNLIGHLIKKSDVYGIFMVGNQVINLEMPVSATLIEINPLLNTNSMLVNTDPEGKGWLIRARPIPALQTDVAS